MGRSRPGFPAHNLAAILLVGEAQVDELPAPIERRQVRHQGAVAHRVGGLHVQIDMQARCFAGQQREGELEYLLLELLVRLGLAKPEQPLFDHIVGEVAKVVDGNRKFSGRADALIPIGAELNPQHRMTHGQRGSGLA